MKKNIFVDGYKIRGQRPCKVGNAFLPTAFIDKWAND